MPDYKIEAGEYLPMEAWVKVPGVSNPLAGGARFFFTLKLSRNDPDTAALVAKNSPDGGIVHVPPDKAQWTLSSATTDSLGAAYPNQDLVWDVRYRAANGDVKTIGKGVIKISVPITRNTPGG